MTEQHDDRAHASSASWKFDFLDTVNADPRCTPTCLKMMKAYLSFASEAAPVAFMARGEMALRTGLGDATIKRTHRLLMKLGYLERISKTKGGAIQYRLVNARKAIIDDHLLFGREKLADDAREKRRLERVRKGIKMSPLHEDGWDQNEPPIGIKMSPNSLENTLEVLAMKGEVISIGAPSFYSEAKGDDPKAPFPIPETDDQAEDMLRQIVCNRDVADYVVNAMGLMLRKGTLSPANAESLINQYREVAA
ncbi:MAG TPA: hypothetical protein VGN93_06215 [Shinella sp.]|jgi:hypothetical protein|uniref:hypothetical protein n=1 Tax=Shinella sp. TaxID=1870904 RepID=UPI002E11557E|nr:hypothetical protein [Shinella sp.]